MHLRNEWLNHFALSPPRWIMINGYHPHRRIRAMQRSRVWNTKIVRAATVPRLLDEGWLSNPDDSGVSLSLSRLLLFSFFFLPLSPMIIHVRGARHDRQSILLNDTLPLPLFRWWFHVPTCCFSIPCYGNRGKRKERSRIFCSCDFKFRRGGGGRDLRGKTRVS